MVEEDTRKNWEGKNKKKLTVCRWPWKAIGKQAMPTAGHRQTRWAWALPRLPRGHGLPLAAAIGKRDGVCERPLLASFADGGGLPMARPST